MASKGKRKKARNKKQAHLKSSERPLTDPHARVMAEQISATVNLMARFADAPDPVVAVAQALGEAVTTVVRDIGSVDVAQLIEVTRIAGLPWAHGAGGAVDPESTAARVELVALLAVAARAERVRGGNAAADEASQTAGGPGGAPVRATVQPVTNLVNGEVLPAIDLILHLAQLLEIAQTDRNDPLAYVAVLMRGAEVYVRNNSYPEMVEELHTELFAHPDVVAALRATLGFSAADALSTLQVCHDMQVDGLNARMQGMFGLVESAMREGSAVGNPNADAVREAWTAAWEPSGIGSVVTVAALAARTGLPVQRTQAVVDFFTLDLGETSPLEVASEFARGGNPLRTNPILAFDGGVMLVHNAHTLGAVRENLEQHLKTTTAWVIFAKHRGEVLERRTHEAITRVLPDAVHRDGFEYYVPATESETSGPPSGYTKRVEADHLVLQDDVALIIEDKAVAVSPASRAGDTRRLRRDLTGIVTKAAGQAGRLQERIDQDGGLQIHKEGWVDLSHIRETHTMAVSLEDLTGVSTATAALVDAGVLDPDSVPWTVSILDLELICRLVDHRPCSPERTPPSNDSHRHQPTYSTTPSATDASAAQPCPCPCPPIQPTDGSSSG